MTRVGRNNNRDNWMLYWLSDAPSDWLLVKWINAETSWDVTVKDESDKLRGSFSKLLPHARDPFKQEQLHLRFFFLVCSLPPSLTSFLPSLSFVSLSLSHSSQVFYSAKADVVIYCGHPSLVLIHHRPVARRSWQQLFAFEFNRGAVSQRRQVKSITNAPLSRRIINQRRER